MVIENNKIYRNSRNKKYIMSAVNHGVADVSNYVTITTSTLKHIGNQYTTDTLSSAINEIKGTLNSRQDTAGVSRVYYRDGQFYIYYKKEVKIDDVLDNVLSFLKNANFGYLEFFKVDRQKNAIIFDVSYLDSAKELYE